jgi:hypothetical protein
LNHEIEEDEIGRARSTHEKRNESIYDFGGNARRKETARKI